MAIAGTNKASVYSGSNATSYATGSWTPGANRLAIACVEAEISGTPVAPTSVTGNGLTWTKIVDYACDTSGTQLNISVWAALTGGSPSAGAVTADFNGVTQAGCNVIVDEFTGAYVSGTVSAAFIQNKTGTVNGSGTSESISLTSAITAGNASYGVFGHQTDETTTQGSGYTQLGVGSHAGPASALMTEYKAAGAQTVDASWTTSSGRGGIALEIKTAGGLSGSVGQTSETDTAQTIARSKSKAIGQPSEADSAQTISRRKIRTTGQTSETDSAQAIARSKAKAVGQNTETDQALAISRRKIRTTGQPSETDSAQAIARSKVKAVGQPSETDQALAIGAQKRAPVTTVTETDQALAIAARKVRAVGLAEETDSALDIQRLTGNLVGQVQETDLALAIAARKVRAIGLAEETDSALAIGARKIRAIGQIGETDQAMAMAPAHGRSIGLALETDLAPALMTRKVRTLGIAEETDQALAILAQVEIARARDIDPMERRRIHQTQDRVIHRTDRRKANEL